MEQGVGSEVGEVVPTTSWGCLARDCEWHGDSMEGGWGPSLGFGAEETCQELIMNTLHCSAEKSKQNITQAFNILSSILFQTFLSKLKNSRFHDPPITLKSHLRGQHTPHIPLLPLVCILQGLISFIRPFLFCNDLLQFNPMHTTSTGLFPKTFRNTVPRKPFRSHFEEGCVFFCRPRLEVQDFGG